jgi:hypothetical protein
METEHKFYATMRAPKTLKEALTTRRCFSQI